MYWMLWIYAHHIFELSSMLSTLTYCLYTTRNVRQKHSTIPSSQETMGIIPKRAWSRVIVSKPRARCGSIRTHISILQDFYQLRDRLGVRYIECELVTHHQTHTQALSEVLSHSMAHRRLWEIIQVFSHLCRHIFISLHCRPIATVLYIIPTHIHLCLPLQYPFMANFGDLCLFSSHMTYSTTCDPIASSHDY